MNIAGNFQTEDEEIRVVKAYFKRNKIEYEKVWKHHDANAGDLMHCTSKLWQVLALIGLALLNFAYTWVLY